MKPLDLILLIDDDDTTNHVNLRTLTRNNLAKEVKVFTNGTQALDYLKSGNCNPAFPGTQLCPDLIFLDIKMPVMDGFEFLEEFRNLGIGKDGTPVIMMLTSSASFYDLKRLETYQEVKRHFDKPLGDQDLKQIIGDYFPERFS